MSSQCLSSMIRLSMLFPTSYSEQILYSKKGQRSETTDCMMLYILKVCANMHGLDSIIYKSYRKTMLKYTRTIYCVFKASKSK